MSQVLNFALFYYHWWPNLILTLASVTIQCVMRQILLREQSIENNSLYAIFIILLTLWIGASVWLVHLAVTKIGLAIVNYKILDLGNKELLNNLDQALVILDGETREEIFVNTSTAKLNFPQESNNSIQNSIHQSDFVKLTLSDAENLFARVDLDLFKNATADSKAICQ